MRMSLPIAYGIMPGVQSVVQQAVKATPGVTRKRADQYVTDAFGAARRAKGVPLPTPPQPANNLPRPGTMGLMLLLAAIAGAADPRGQAGAQGLQGLFNGLAARNEQQDRYNQQVYQGQLNQYNQNQDLAMLDYQEGIAKADRLYKDSDAMRSRATAVEDDWRNFNQQVTLQGIQSRDALKRDLAGGKAYTDITQFDRDMALAKKEGLYTDEEIAQLRAQAIIDIGKKTKKDYNLRIFPTLIQKVNDRKNVPAPARQAIAEQMVRAMQADPDLDALYGGSEQYAQLRDAAEYESIGERIEAQKLLNLVAQGQILEAERVIKKHEGTIKEIDARFRTKQNQALLDERDARIKKLKTTPASGGSAGEKPLTGTAKLNAWIGLKNEIIAAETDVAKADAHIDYFAKIADLTQERGYVASQRGADGDRQDALQARLFWENKKVVAMSKAQKYRDAMSEAQNKMNWGDGGGWTTVTLPSGQTIRVRKK